MTRRGLFVLLMALLAFDMATPLLPGAYRFNPDESVEVLRDGGARPAVAAPGPRTHPTAVGVSMIERGATARAGVTALAWRADHLPCARRITASASDGPSRSTDDH